MKHTIDYTKLENQVLKKAYRLADVKDHLEIVAFDIVRFKDGDKGAQLWQVQSAEDGEYIVALYQGEEEEKTASPWDVSLSKVSGELQFSYHGDPLVRVASSKLGIPRSDLDKVPEYLPEKLASNPKLVQALLKEMPASAKKMALDKYPELGTKS
jgi:hypothetical protein